MPTAVTSTDQLCVNTIRTLAMDAVQQANSGHPGTPMALAPLAYRLFTRHIRHDPTAPDWPDRDRFILSCGHASTLLYSVLHLSGYDITLDDIRRFRQLHSPTAGHPERGELPGIEFTTGPLGQGFAAAVGMAVAERHLAARFNTERHDVINHWTWVLASDGDLMEGVHAEAASLAGHLGLGKLVVFWDDNRITIDGTTDITFTEDVAARFRSYGWQVLELADVDDLDAIDAVVDAARADERPTLVATRTHIGIGSPLQDSPKAHGAPLGADNIRTTKRAYGWPEDSSFLVPDDVHTTFDVVRERAEQLRGDWIDRTERWRSDEPTLAREFDRCNFGSLPVEWSKQLDEHHFDPAGSMATRKASHIAINLIAPSLPELIGGSADLAESNLTDIADGGSFARTSPADRNIRYGIREHAMGAITNGMVAHGGLRAFAGTFLVFSDYMRPAIRLSALMGLPSTWVFTHDSVWLGEDGPTHQPIEHIASLRAMPNLLVIRPADAYETLAAWKVAVEQRDRPTALLLSRQALPIIDATADEALLPEMVGRGAYVVRECLGEPQLILLASGSEVALCINAATVLEGHGVRTRVVSMPCHELFEEQPNDYRHYVLPPTIAARVSVEAGSTQGWHRWVGEAGVTIGIDRFGLSAPGDEAANELGINVANVVQTGRRIVAHMSSEAGNRA